MSKGKKILLILGIAGAAYFLLTRRSQAGPSDKQGPAPDFFTDADYDELENGRRRIISTAGEVIQQAPVNVPPMTIGQTPPTYGTTTTRNPSVPNSSGFGSVSSFTSIEPNSSGFAV